MSLQKTTRKMLGVSAIDMMLVLAVISSAFLLTMYTDKFFTAKTKAQGTAQQAYNYSGAVVRYITTHQNLLRELLAKEGSANPLIATIPATVLFDEGFIKNKVFYQNNLEQYPCTIIYYENHQLQSFLYYRANNNKTQLDQAELNQGLNFIGAMLGLYKNGEVFGYARGWYLNTEFTRDYFVQNSSPSVDMSQGADPSRYNCVGSQIAQNSYVVNITSLLGDINKLPKDDTIHQYSDILHDADDPASNNRMIAELNMDFRGKDNNKQDAHIKSNVIFGLNPECEMDPNKPETMQDFDPFVEGKYDDNKNKPNDLGCRNRQLGITATKDPTADKNATEENTLLITGPKRGGDRNLWVDITDPKNPIDTRPYVGEVRAFSFQPTTFIANGTACTQKELGAIARQIETDDPDDVNNIYISIVMCMRAPLCDKKNGSYCYLPIQPVTIRYHPNSESFTCPMGTFFDPNHVELEQANQPDACHAKDCKYQPFDCHYKNPRFANFISGYKSTEPLDTSVASIYRTLTVDDTLWIQDCHLQACHFGCDGESRDYSWPTRGKIRSVECTNDPSKASIYYVKN